MNKENLGWSMERVHRVVHGRGPRGSPWTGSQCFQLSHGKSAHLLNLTCFRIEAFMEVSSESPRVPPPGIGWGIRQFSVPER